MSSSSSFVTSDSRSMFGIFLSAIGQSYIIPMDNVRTNQMPTMTALYQNERRNRLLYMYCTCTVHVRTCTVHVLYMLYMYMLIIVICIAM